MSLNLKLDRSYTSFRSHFWNKVCNDVILRIFFSLVCRENKFLNR